MLFSIYYLRRLWLTFNFCRPQPPVARTAAVGTLTGRTSVSSNSNSFGTSAVDAAPGPLNHAQLLMHMAPAQASQAAAGRRQSAEKDTVKIYSQDSRGLWAAALEEVLTTVKKENVFVWLLQETWRLNTWNTITRTDKATRGDLDEGHGDATHAAISGAWRTCPWRVYRGS
jgi:hypothetical protein